MAIPLTIARIPDFREPLRIELITTEAQTGFVSAQPLTLSPTEQQATFTLQFADVPRTVGEQSFLIRPTAEQAGRGMVRSETTVTVDLQDQTTP